MQIIVLALLVLMSLPVWAADAPALARQKACLGCHDVEQHTMAVPSYRQISEKYSAQSDGLDYIKNKIRNGGQGVWGGHMPAFPTLTNQEIDILANWIIEIGK